MLIGSIMQCTEGHMLCSTCYGKLPKAEFDEWTCPTCKTTVDGNIRCRGMEAFRDTLPEWWCRNDDCSWTTTEEKKLDALAEHESVCVHRPVKCGCGETHSGASLLQHMRNQCPIITKANPSECIPLSLGCISKWIVSTKQPLIAYISPSTFSPTVGGKKTQLVDFIVFRVPDSSASLSESSSSSTGSSQRLATLSILSGDPSDKETTVTVLQRLSWMSKPRPIQDNMEWVPFGVTLTVSGLQPYKFEFDGKEHIGVYALFKFKDVDLS
jgi:hypothetical protein